MPFVPIWHGSYGGGALNHAEQLCQVRVAQPWIQKKASSVAFTVCLRRFVRWHTSDAKPHSLRPAAHTPNARPWPSVARVENITARRWRQLQLSIAWAGHVHVLISEERRGASVRHPSRSGTSATGARRSLTHTHQQRCLSLCSSCASWDSSRSPPPVTSKTAPEEGNERCRRLGSDRFGPFWKIIVLPLRLHSNMHKITF